MGTPPRWNGGSVLALVDAEAAPQARQPLNVPLRAVGFLIAYSALFVALIPVIFQPKYNASVPVAETAAVLLLFTAAHLLTKPLDLTEPIHWMNGLMALMFVIHPYLVLSGGKLTAPYHETYYIATNYTRACVVGLLATLALNLGYAGYLWWTSRHGPACTTETIIAEVPPARLVAVAKFCTVAAVIGAGLSSAANGSVMAAFSRSEEVSSAYLYMLPSLFAPAACLWYAAGHLTDDPILRRRGWMIALTVAAVTMAGGQRTGLVTAVGPFLIAVACLNHRRVPRLMAVVLALVAMFGFAFLRDVNGPTGGASNLNEVVSNFLASPVGVLRDTLEGADTEMVDAVSLEMNVVPSRIEFSPRQDFLATVGASIPRAIFPDKPLTIDQKMNGALLGRGVNEASVAYSFFGEAWYAGGYVAVVLFAGVTGLVFAGIRRRYVDSDKSALRTCIYALAIPLSITHLRGTLAYTLAYCLFYLAPLLWIARKQRIETRQLNNQR